MIQRTALLKALDQALSRSRVVVLTGPRQSGKTTLARQGAEIDLVIRRKGHLLGLECKRTDSPKLTRSIRIAREDLGLARFAVVYPGIRRFPISDDVEAVPLSALAEGDSVFPT